VIDIVLSGIVASSTAVKHITEQLFIHITYVPDCQVLACFTCTVYVQLMSLLIETMIWFCNL